MDNKENNYNKDLVKYIDKECDIIKDNDIDRNYTFDKAIKDMTIKENRIIPKDVADRIDKTLLELPEREDSVNNDDTKNKSRKEKHHYMTYIGIAAACIVFVLVFLLPNVSIAYAKTMADIPVLGDIIKVVTIRDFKYEDKNHEMDIKVPNVEGEDKNQESVDYINKDVKELTDILVKQFYDDVEDIGDEGHSSVYVDHEVVTNTKEWFTLRIRVHEAAGSSNTYYKYYHIDNRDGKIIYLKDLFKDDTYSEVLKKEIIRQMKEQMKKDKDLKYWTEDDEIVGDVINIDGKHNFYFDEKGRLVIHFDKYEAAPGYMGCPEFTIEKSKIKSIIKDKFIEF